MKIKLWSKRDNGKVVHWQESNFLWENDSAYNNLHGRVLIMYYVNTRLLWYVD